MSYFKVLSFPVKIFLLFLPVFLSYSINHSYAMSSDDPADWLKMMIDARKTQTYQGIFVFSRGDEMSSMRVLHSYTDGVEQERLIALDGEPREIIRTGDMVICIFPNNEQVQLEQALPTGPFQTDLKDITPLKAVYSIKVAGMERLAGYEVIKVAVMAKDQFRYSYLLWLEKNTGLMIKSALIGQDGEALERFQFTSLEIGGSISEEELTGAAVGSQVTHQARPEGGDVANPPLPHYWQLEWLPEGFSPAQYVTKRNSVMPEKSRTRVYSDGLAMFSVFVEPHSDKGMPEGASKMGATAAYSKYVTSDKMNYIVTIVGEVPLATAEKIADNLRILPLTGKT
jgi:sigma-E factor negative regulatory protein RseB